MTQEKLREIKEDLKEYIESNPELNNTKLAEKYLKENNDVPLSVRSIRQYVSLVKAANEGIEDDASIDKDENGSINVDFTEMSDMFQAMGFTQIINPWESNGVVNNTVEEPDNTIDGTDMVILDYSSNKYQFNRTDIDKLFCAYSRKGLNLTNVVSQELLGFTGEEFRAIVARTGLNKESEPYSDYSASMLSDADLYKELDDNINFLLDKLQKHDGTVVTPLVKQYKKAILKYSLADLRFSAMVEELKDSLEAIKINTLPRPVHKEIGDQLHTHIFIPDIHIGLYQDNYNIDIVRHKLGEVAEIARDMPRIHLHFLGDIIQSVSGLNHDNSWKNMTPGVHGANAIIEPFKLLRDFILSFNDIYSVDIVGGEMVAA